MIHHKQYYQYMDVLVAVIDWHKVRDSVRTSSVLYIINKIFMAIHRSKH